MQDKNSSEINGNDSGFDRERHWRSHLADIKAHHGSVKSYCRTHGLSADMMYYWRKKLSINGSGAARRLPMIIGKPAFARVEAAPAAPTTRAVGLPDAKWVAEFIVHLGILCGAKE